MASQVVPDTTGWNGSSRVFAALDRYLWQLTYKWACYRHSDKPKPWIVNRYFGRYNKSRQDRWVFGDRDSGAYLPKFAWTTIVRHQLVRGQASPDDPTQGDYWATRRRKRKPLLDPSTLRLLHNQHGRRTRRAAASREGCQSAADDQKVRQGDLTPCHS